ncbi:MAG: glutathione S-transferase family protein [Ectothiorhodospiraceae bacterium]|nr:glutathione S-transferase family protein [Chromatiales bacterium]MCP5154518.1 glutathione S-transferase family protein [Ectothiorhodospiraceae bacterium]
MLHVWGRRNSINVMKVLWCLDELGVEYQRSEAGLQHGVVDSPEYRAMNPNGRVPTIVDDGFVLWESNAIVRYLCAKHAAGTWWPVDPQARAVAEQWMDWQHTVLLADMTVVFWGLVRTPPEKRDPERIAQAAVGAGRSFAMLDAALTGKDYLLGDAISMGDIPLGAFAWRWSALDIERPHLPAVEAWLARLKARPAFQQHVMLPLT